MTKPKLRFKEFNDKWINTNIKNISLLLKDGTHGSYNDTIDGIPLLSAKDIENGKIQIPCDCRRISLKDYNDIFKNYKLEINDILLTIVGTIGRLAIIENTTEKYAFQRSVAIIRINQENNPKFILYILQTNNVKKQFYARVNQSAQGGIYLDTLGKTNIALPCFEEQEKIAGFLSKVDELINECEGEVKDLEEQKKGLMQKIFSQQIRFKDSNNTPYPDWEEKKIGEVFNISAGGDINKYHCTKEKTDTNIYPVYANALTNNGLYGYTNCYKIKNPAITVTGRGDVGHAVSRKEPFYPIVRLLVLQPKQKLDIDFYTYAINRTRIFVESTGVPQLTSPQIAKVKIFVPCLEEQEKIAKVLSKMDELIEEKKALFSDWQQFKKGLLQQMFV